MNVTEAKIRLASDRTEKLKAFCSITVDREFVVRDIKIIQGVKGCFVAMPSRKLMDRCPSCGGKNHLRAAYCNECGTQLRTNRVGHDDGGRAKLHADIAHPINSACRERLQQQILAAYERELEKSRQPGYVAPAEDDEFLEADAAGGPISQMWGDQTAPRDAETPKEPQPEPPPPGNREDSFSGGIM